MNWTDLIVVAIIIGMAVLGMYRGFIYSAYRVLSYFLSIFLAIKLAPVGAKFLEGTSLFTKIENAITTNMLEKFEGVVSAGVSATKEEFLKTIPIPSFLKENIANSIPVNISGAEIVSPISHQISLLVVDVLAMIAVFILIKIGLSFLGVLIKGIAKLPVFKQMDKLGGLVFGIGAGILVVYVALAVLMLFNASSSFEGIYKAVNNSLIAKGIYENNFIIHWLNPTNESVEQAFLGFHENDSMRCILSRFFSI